VRLQRSEDTYGTCVILPIYLTSTIGAGSGGWSLTTVFSPVGQVPAGLVQARFVLAGLHAAVHAARRAFRAAVHAARDAAPYRPSGPRPRWVELRAPNRPPIPVRETCFAVRPFSIPFLRSCLTSGFWFGDWRAARLRLSLAPFSVWRG